MQKRNLTKVEKMLKEGTIKDILKVHELEKEIFSQPTSLDTLKENLKIQQ